MLNEAKNVIKILNEKGFQAYMVGGFVRDYLLNHDFNDIDITTNALPNDVMNIFKSKPVGIKFGTVLVFRDEYNFEVTTFRIDGKYNDSRHPELVTFSSNLKDDLARRDFTINAMALDVDMNLYDYYGGKADLDNHIIRAVGDAEERFNEDALRILRAFYFMSKLGFDIEEKTLSAMKKTQNGLKNISIERVQSEIKKIGKGKFRAKAFKLMQEFEIFKYFNLSFNYLYDDYLDIYIASFYKINEIPKMYKFSKNEKYIISKSIELLNSFNCYDIYLHYLYRDIYERVIRLYNLINKENIKIINSDFIINNLSELKIKSKNLTSLKIEPIYHSKILKILEEEVVRGIINNTFSSLRTASIKIYEKIKE